MAGATLLSSNSLVIGSIIILVLRKPRYANAIRIVYTYYGAAIMYRGDPIHPLYVSMSSSYTINYYYRLLILFGNLHQKP